LLPPPPSPPPQVMGEADLRDAFYAYGEVRSVKLLPDKKCAFVDYTSREGAELAASKLHRNLVVCEREKASYTVFFVYCELRRPTLFKVTHMMSFLFLYPIFVDPTFPCTF